MRVEDMISSDFGKFVLLLNDKFPLGNEFKIFRIVDENYDKIICFYSKSSDIHPFATLKINDECCEFDEDSPFDSKLASSILRKFLTSNTTTQNYNL